MVDRASLGATGTPFELDVDRSKLRELARATFTVPDVDGWALPTFLTTAFHWQSGESDPWELVRMDPSRGLHAEQDFVFHGPPPRVGDRLTGVSRISDIYEKKNGALVFVKMVTEFTDATGRVVAETTLTAVEKA